MATMPTPSKSSDGKSSDPRVDVKPSATASKPAPAAAAKPTVDTAARAAKTKALEAAVGQIEKNFGKGSIMRLDNESVPAQGGDAIPVIDPSTGATFAQAGAYRLRVTNSLGEATSPAGVLTVQKRPGSLAFGVVQPSFLGTVNVIRFLPDGSYLVGGEFTTVTVNGTSTFRNYLVRILADQTLDHRAVFRHGALGALPRLRPGELRHRGGQRLAQRGGHHVQAGEGIVIGLVDPFVATVPVHGVGDQRDGALVVVDGGQVGGQQQQHVGQVQVIDGQFRQPLQAADEVVGEVTHQAAGQRRHVRPDRSPGRFAPARRGSGGEQLHGLPQRLQRIPALGCAPRGGAQPHRLPVAHRQRRR
jgi:hypothetical protein